jgi:SAM-dependent methyltransferase/ketosteroid isomerase-like protein
MTADPLGNAEESTVLAFNAAINRRDLQGLELLMAEDHRFIDSAGSAIDGKSACLDAWRGFFEAFPDYRNVFDSVRSRPGGIVDVSGHSECSEPALDGPARWRAVVANGLVVEWRVFDAKDVPPSVEAFVTSHLPDSPSKILEVGCGDGELAQILAERGHAVTAIDPKAPNGPIFRQVALEAFAEPGPFEAIVANRSLHHIHDLDEGLRKMGALLSPDGILVVSEFAWDQMDERTARWYLSHVPERDAAHHLHAGNLGEWIAEHEGLHRAGSMRAVLDRYFRETFFEWTPYIAEDYLERSDLIAEEARLIENGEINAVGFRYAGKLGDRSSSEAPAG